MELKQRIGVTMKFNPPKKGTKIVVVILLVSDLIT
jgi:hypothetical protein